MSTNPTRAAPAPRTTELDQLSIEEDAARTCLVDDVLDRIAATCHLAELDGIVRDMWVDHTNGLLAEAQMEVLDETARARRAAIQSRRQAAQREPPRRPGDAPRPPGRPQRVTPRSPGPARVGPRPKREKMFGDGRAVPLDRNAKARIMTLARALMRPTEKGKHWGPITAKFFEVLKALLWAFHNAKSGRCFPSYETIARKADCGEDTVARAIVALEQAGLLSWCNRLARVAIKGVVKVIRTSNSYWFNDPGSKYEFKSGTRFTVNQERKQDGASRAEDVSRKRGRDIQPEIPREEVA
jgi:Helix-turn-helix domain